ncbi:unnamed protein product [Didymodactylos carnosus]|uniref:RRM domain-containing protein n=1 Tax=Didymodactylos carnosus TaxID=1234261 RepID=A0A8S2EGN8_9BILA|nr:unnamed protein product [Didymodactylos carnosus]CAF4027883.1 unnamed protein product [Didymodactylos carnosus]
MPTVHVSYVERKPCHVLNGDDGIHMLKIGDGRSSGECFVDLESDEDVRVALLKSKDHMENRYIEIFRAKNAEYNFYVKNNGLISWREPVVRVRGLPYRCSTSDIQELFSGIEISKNGVYIARDVEDRATGDGFVAFINMDNAYEAMEIKRKQIGHRYIEIYPSTYEEARQRIVKDTGSNSTKFSRPKHFMRRENGRGGRRSRTRSRSESQDRRADRSLSPRPRNNNRRNPPPRSRSPIRRRSLSRSPRKYAVKMRGLPFRVTENDIKKFFSSFCEPSAVEIFRDRETNRPNGDALAYFDTENDAQEALKFDQKYIGNRYVELYYDSSRTFRNNGYRRSRSLQSPRQNRNGSRSHSRTRQRTRTRSRSDRSKMASHLLFSFQKACEHYFDNAVSFQEEKRLY